MYIWKDFCSSQVQRLASVTDGFYSVRHLGALFVRKAGEGSLPQLSAASAQSCNLGDGFCN